MDTIRLVHSFPYRAGRGVAFPVPANTANVTFLVTCSRVLVFSFACLERGFWVA
jgi:hypothetical protein